MRYTEIFYKVNNKTYTEVVRERKGWKEQYLQSVLNAIESITDAKGVTVVITGIIQHN